MAKEVKKKSRRLKKTVRKTLGALFLASSLVVAAIPVDGLQAETRASGARAEGNVSVTTDSSVKIPQIDEDTTIYTTGDRKYRFAYLSDGGTDKIAVLLGYGALTLENNTLVIPDKVDAYAKYTESLGTDDGYVAVGKNGNFLFYEKITLVETGETVSDNDGNVVPVTKEVISYVPCYYDNISEWEDISFDQLYYDKTDPDGTLHPGVELTAENAVKTTEPIYQRIQGATVAYISNQYIEQGADGKWKLGTENGGLVTAANKEKGVFAQNGNIVTLVVGKDLIGIGDYAFYRCSGLNSITLGNGLNTIGNGAFSDCVNMSTINLELHSNLNEIGDHAFYNCQKLREFIVPVQVSKIGDSAFEGCTSIGKIDLCSNGEFNNLTTLGRDVFKNCESLKSLTFPDKCTAPVYVSAFEGCRSLEYVSARNKQIIFPEEEGVYSYEAFKKMLDGTPVNGAFYFEGFDDSALHDMTKEHCFAFSYIDYLNGSYIKLDRYELTVEEEGGLATYEVNSTNTLNSCITDPGVTTITIPGRIGPYAINYISSTTFQDHCNIEKVTIPANITRIGGEAFRGCHNLANVIFETGTVEIGDNAFKTQDTRSHETSCPNGGYVLNDSDDSPAVKLHFSGPVSASSGPFRYAMSEAGKYNVQTQKPSYITYYSGWPSNLEIQYNPDTKMSELVNFPSFADLKNGTYNSTDYAYITDDHESAANTALSKYPDQYDEMTEYEKEIVNSALKIEIPEAVESVKAGLFKEKEIADMAYAPTKEVVAYSLKTIEYDEDASVSGSDAAGVGTFAGCEKISKITLLGDTTTIEDHAFKGCTALEEVDFPPTIDTVGIRPFAGCTSLKSVNFQDNPDYVCSNYIIYGPDSQGNSRKKVIEYLESRKSGVIDGVELSGVTELAEEAFMGSNVSNVDLKQTTITTVPEKAFADTPKLTTVRLPYTCKSIMAEAFENSELEYIEIPVATAVISPEAFNVAKPHEDVTFYCEDDSVAHDYAVTYGFHTTTKPEEKYYTVNFWDWDEELQNNVIVDTQTVQGGFDAEPPTPRGRDGYVFVDWTLDYTAISKDMDLTARYEKEDENLYKYEVVFKDHDGTVLKTVMVDPGATAEAPKDPTREGYIFIGWLPAVTNIQEDTIIWAQYKERPEDEFVVRYIGKDDSVIYTATVKYGEDAPSIVVPEIEGYKFTGWRPGITNITKDTDAYAQYEKIEATDDGSNDGTGGDGTGNGTGNGTGDGSGNGSGNGNGTGNGSGSGSGSGDSDDKKEEDAKPAKTYTLTVRNGSGSGSYVAGSQPIIIANDPAANQEFSNWTIDPEDTKIASKVLTATVITMPDENVTVTANYKAKTTTGTGGGSSSGNNTNKPNNGTVSQGGTTVVIDKNGLSNTGVVSATVNGSSDNFTIKISESSSASEAAVKALMAEYGDLDNIKYFPMDISLYDSTGQTKITDTSGLSISITLPLPDSMIKYAGNNKVAGIVNDRLDKMSAKFTTISGVPCITFTAEHFSPYVIYVDTGNLSSGTVIDTTPKTGDGIHPKWFLSVGLACMSVVFFMKKDKKTVKKRLVKA